MFSKSFKNDYIILFLVLALFLTVQVDCIRWFELEHDFKNYKVKLRPMKRKDLKKYLFNKYKRKRIIQKKLFNLIFIFVLIYFLTETPNDSYDVFSYSNVSFFTFTPFILANLSSDDRIDITHVDNEIILNFGSFSVTFKEKSLEAKLAIIFLSTAVFKPTEKGQQKKLSHNIISLCSGFSPVWVSKLIKRFEKYGIIGLIRIPNGGYLGEKAVERVFALLAEDITLTPNKISKILVEENLCETENTAAVRNVLANCNLLDLKPYLEGQITGETGNRPLKILLDQAMSLLDKVLLEINNPDFIKLDYDELRKKIECQVEKIGIPKKWDQNNKGVKAEKRKAQKQNKLIDIITLGEPLVRCPRCRSTNVKSKQEYERKYQNSQGYYKNDLAKHYKCAEPLCDEEFTVSPKDIEAYVNSDRNLQKYVIKQILHANVSLRRIVTEGIDGVASISHTNILRWIKVTADTLPEFTEVFGVRCSAKVSIDEKFVKLRGKWHYVFMAIDIATLDVIHINIYTTRSKESAELFLKEIKAMGYKIDVIVTDGCNIYDESIPKVYNNAKHLHCVLHLGRSARNRLVKIIGSRTDEDYKHLSKLLSNIFCSREKKEFDTAWFEWKKEQKKLHKKYPKLITFSKKLSKEKTEIRERTLSNKEPRTSNAAEHVIGEFDRKYENMQSFMSFYYAQAWCKLFQVYYRLHKFKRGNRAGKSPAELAFPSAKDVDYLDFMFPGEELNIVERQRKLEKREMTKQIS